ncbi:phage tail spike protein [Paenibacillus pini]|uniref:YomG protein n=1 Tax=Paenibacillus pini JCM 16418 TaxID=1236976 RepID=W7YYW7_9BACL|nr:phage tail spike protein [Paenibacillus pini]GAF07579.1 YomG protein [Paenibacillus pini JCM 16418]
MIDIIDSDIIKPKYFLCRPDLKRTTIANLSEATSDSQKLSRGNVNELTFSVPLFLSKKNKRVKNKHVDLIKEKYHIRVEKGKHIEYYLINKIIKTMDDMDTIKVECFSLPFELSTKLIKNYSVVSYNATQILVDMLQSTIWNVGYVDAQFDLKYRTFDFTGSVLSAVQQIASTFTALIVWDTVKRQVNLYDPDTYGSNKGFKTKYGKLMQGITQELNLDEFCTRLKLFGKDDMSIQEVNPLGGNFIQDFSYFMYPFAIDDKGNITSHSFYMSDELCIALNKYNKLVESKTSDYSNLLKQKSTQEEKLNKKTNRIINT